MAALAPPLPIVEIPLELFGGTDSELDPSDCPEGLSPDNQDVAFLPGSVFVRPGTKSVFDPHLGVNQSVLYEKTYVQPNGTTLTLLLTTDGTIYAENVTSSPGTATQISSVPPNLYAQSVSAFGREYIAFSDLLHGQGIPLQYDGTNLDRVTQDGPGVGPTVNNFKPQPATIQNLGVPTTFNIVAGPSGIVFGGSSQLNPTPPPFVQYFTNFQVTTTAPHGFTTGASVTLTGSTSTPNVNGTYSGIIVTSATTFTVTFYYYISTTDGSGHTVTNPVPAVNGGGGTVTGTNSNTSLSRNGNVVTVVTSAPHGFKSGWQVQVSGISNTNLGGGITAISRDGNGVVTVTTSSPHGLPAQAFVAIAGVTNPDTSFNVASIQIQSVPSPTTFTYLQNGTAENSSAGSGNVQDIWNFTAFIQSIPTPTTFTYQQIGANDSTTASGTSTIIGQVSPGTHQFVLIFLTRDGALTKPSPITSFVASGGAQVALGNILIGPANVVARVIGATGAGGGDFFTITQTPHLGMQITGTALIIPDNTSTSAILDFSDNTLFDGIPIDVIGNDLFDQVVLGTPLGFFSFASRLVTWGDWNKVENLLNMGFDGGFLSGSTSAPAPWISNSSTPGTLVPGGAWTSGLCWSITGDGSTNALGRVDQSFYQDEFGDAIAQPSTTYLFRCWCSASNRASGSVQAIIQSGSTGFLATATIPLNLFQQNGSFASAVFNLPTPAVIPSDLTFGVCEIGAAIGAVLKIDENQAIFNSNPYRNNLSRFSYDVNPEGFAQTTGNLGPADDPSPIRCFSLQRSNALLKTAEGIHEFTDNTGEPDTWVVNAITRAVGAMSLRSADPGKFGSGDAAEDWDVVADSKGLYLFAGGDHWKISQEYQVYWDRINLAAQQTVVIKNDPHFRRIYCAVPLDQATTPSHLLVMDYRELDTAVQISGAAPLHITLAGLMKSSDLTRKWTRWNLAVNALEILIRPGNKKRICLGGNFGNIYTLDLAKKTDDDYGQKSPYYDTYGFATHDQEQQFQLGAGVKDFRTMQIAATGIGLFQFIPMINSLKNPLPPSSPRQLVTDADQATALPYDLEWIMTFSGNRCFFRVMVSPLPGTTDVDFNLKKMVVGMSKSSTAYRRSSLL